MKKFIENLVEANEVQRDLFGLSKSKYAAKIGLAQSTYSDLTNGKRDILDCDVKTLISLTRAFSDLEIAYMIEGVTQVGSDFEIKTDPI